MWVNNKYISRAFIERNQFIWENQRAYATMECNLNFKHVMASFIEGNQRASMILSKKKELACVLLNNTMQFNHEIIYMGKCNTSLRAFLSSIVYAKRCFFFYSIYNPKACSIKDGIS